MLLRKLYSLPYWKLVFAWFPPEFRGVSVGLALMFAPTYLPAVVRMPALFSDHMVLQQDLVLPVWGWADPGGRVEV